LLAAELDVASGAGTCKTETSAVAHANTLLTGIHDTGPVGNKIGSNGAQRTDFVNTATTLNTYNNNVLC
jgi:hypothetical protein